MKVSFAPGARDELAEAVAWYLDAAGLVVAEEFELEFDAVVRLVLRLPHIGTTGIRGTRRLRLDRFPYTLHYRIDGDTLLVVAVAHQRRKPNYWRGRV